MSKPKIFIGSSIEGLDIANAVQQNLDHEAEVTIWTQGIYKLSTTIITTLIKSLDNFDFAIFVFSPDDLTIIRGSARTSVRDNVIFEMGLFSGKLGIDKVFFIKPRNNSELNLPTDLLGIVAGEYNDNRSDKNLVAATGPFCNQVKQKINTFKLMSPTVLAPITNTVNYENDLRILFAYMDEKNWSTMSFAKIKENVHPRFTEEHLMKLVETFPLAIRRCKLKDGAFGIKFFIEDL